MALTEILRGMGQAWFELMARVERHRLQELAEIRSNVFMLFTTLDEAQLPKLALRVLEATQERPYLDGILGKVLEDEVDRKVRQNSGVLLKWVVSEVIEQIDHPPTLRLILTEPLAEARGIWEARLNTPGQPTDNTLLTVQRLGQIQISLEQVNGVVLPP